MDSLTLSIAIAGITSVSGAILGILFVFARDEGDRLAEDNTELRAALDAKRKEADTLSDDVSRLSRQIKEQSETLAYREREINSFHKRGYIRNAYGTLQRYADWLEKGDKKPKNRDKKRDEPKTKTMTRAEACLAILHEAKDAGFPWAQSAIDQFDTKWANLPSVPYSKGLQRAIMEFADHSKTTEGFDYWDNVLDYREVKSFKPNTQWPA